MPGDKVFLKRSNRPAEIASLISAGGKGNDLGNSFFDLYRICLFVNPLGVLF